MSADTEPSSREPERAASGPSVSAELTATDGSQVRASAPMPRAGERIGRYVVLAPLGAGAMGVVVSAYDGELDRRVAIKLIRGDPDAARPVDASRLLREAQALARLSHPNVVPIFDAGTTDRGSVFLAMELVEGSTLREWIELVPRPWPQVLTVMAAAAEGLAAAHEAQIVHRDFKPDNVLLDRQGVPKVSDFGLSRGQGEFESTHTAVDAPDTLSERLTRTGAVMGTPGYMSPEQHLGAPVDARSDQYSFFVSLYELLWGTRPFQGRNVMALAYAKLHEVIESPARRRAGDPPQALFDAIRRGLARHPADRFASMTEVAALLRRLASRRRRRWIVPLALAVTTAGVAIAQRQPGSACADADSQLDDAWDGQRRAALTAAFASAHTPAAARATALTIDALDTHAQQWKGEYQAACALQPSAETDATFSCLRRRRAHLQAVATMLSEGGRDLVHRAGEIVASLESPGACAQAPAELHAAQDEEHEALGALVDRAWVRVEGGQYEAARAIAREAEAEALRLGDDEAVGHARLYLGMALARTGHFDEAETEYVEAFEGAIAHGHDEIAVRAALRMAFLEAGERGRTLEARRWLRHAQALLDRLQLPPGTLHARLHEVTAQVLENEGDDAGAREEMERALQIRTTFDAPDSLAMSTLRNNLGTLLTRQGRLQESLAMHERALADRIARVGPSHPEVAMSLLNLAQVQLYRGRWDDALASLARAEPVIAGVQGWSHPWMVNLRMVRAGTLSAMGASERAQIDAQFALTMTIVRYGDQSAQAARAWNILGGVFFDDWDFDGAQWAFDRALTLFDALGGSAERGAALVRANLGALAFRRGELDRAETSMLAALEGIQRRFGPEHSDTGLCHVYLAGIALARDQPHEALEHLDHAERVLAGDEHRGSVYVLYHLARARAQWAAGRDRRQARQEAERALELAAPGTPDQREVEAWLASHRVEEPRP